MCVEIKGDRISTCKNHCTIGIISYKIIIKPASVWSNNRNHVLIKSSIL